MSQGSGDWEDCGDPHSSVAGSRFSQNKTNKHKSKNVTNKDMQNAWHCGKM